MGTKLFASMASVISLTLVTLPASATTFVFDATNPGGNEHVGLHKKILTSFDDNTDIFTWESTFQKNPNNNKLADGAWLVISEGPNPKGDRQEYPIFYIDGKKEKVSLYTYNGVNGSGSWKDDLSTFLGEVDLDVQNIANERTFRFSLDMTDINNRQDLGPDWKGTSFGESIGIWFHGVDKLKTAYNNSGLTKFSYQSSGWYDIGNRPTQSVPEPGILMGLGMMGLLSTRLRKRA